MAKRKAQLSNNFIAILLLFTIVLIGLPNLWIISLAHDYLRHLPYIEQLPEPTTSSETASDAPIKYSYSKWIKYIVLSVIAVVVLALFKGFFPGDPDAFLSSLNRITTRVVKDSENALKDFETHVGEVTSDVDKLTNEFEGIKGEVEQLTESVKETTQTVIETQSVMKDVGKLVGTVESNQDTMNRALKLLAKVFRAYKGVPRKDELGGLTNEESLLLDSLDDFDPGPSTSTGKDALGLPSSSRSFLSLSRTKSNDE